MGEDPAAGDRSGHQASTDLLRFQNLFYCCFREGKGPLALRVAFVSDDGEPVGGFDVTEAGTQKRLQLAGLLKVVERLAQLLRLLLQFGSAPVQRIEFGPLSEK